jgi:hypothetical protein
MSVPCLSFLLFGDANVKKKKKKKKKLLHAWSFKDKLLFLFFLKKIKLVYLIDMSFKYMCFKYMCFSHF